MSAADEPLVLVRYGELATKGGNRGDFERALARNIASAARDVAPVTVERIRGRMFVRAERRAERVARRLQEVFGITSVSLARRVEPELAALHAAARQAVEAALQELPRERPVRFRVEARRADKRFPLTSNELERSVAESLPPSVGERLEVDLTAPELVLGVEVRERDAYVFCGRLPGPGGLPVGTLGSAVCLLSGGIDSPVAAWMAMKRGCEVLYASFHSAPYLGEGSRRKIERLVGRLARWQPRSRLFSFPFAAVQEAVRESAPEGYRTILYRRSMQRIASRLAEREGAGCLVTGESLGQVASQTMENLRCIEAAARVPVLRPLIAFDKQETIERARRIGTYELSALPEPDCCTVFQPRRPVIRGKLALCEEAEARLPLAELERAAFEGAREERPAAE